MVNDFVVYYRDTKEIVTVLFDVGEEPRFLISLDCNAIVIPHNDYIIKNIDGIGYFENLNEKVLYLDDYRGRYEE